ncbi:MAG: exosortase [Oleiphilaceae bacterium]|nr:exosortase [Oleiphilaceae bacterium]
MDGEKLFPKTLSRMAPVLLVIVYGLATFPAWMPVFSRWTKLDESYSHGFLLLLVALFLCLHTARKRTPVTGFYPRWLVPLLPAMALYALGDILRIEAVEQLMLLPLLLGSLAVLWGWDQVKRFIVPVGILFFGLPVWDYLSWPLQKITVWVNELWLSLPGIEFEVEGVFVYLIDVGAFEIAHGCSGLRYLLVGLTLAVLYGELSYRRWQSKLLLVGTGVLLALLANWIRVFVIIYMGYITHMETGLIEDHDSFGWWVFAATLVPLFVLGRWLEGRPGEQSRAGLATDSGAPSGQRPVAGLLCTTGLMLLLAVALDAPSEPADGGARSMALSPMTSGDWSPLYQRQLRGWEPQIKKPDWQYRGTFFNRSALEEGKAPDMTALVALYSYEHQRVGHEVIQYGNRIYDSRTWQLQSRFPVATGDDVVLQGLKLRPRGHGQRESQDLHIAYGYYVQGRWETEPVLTKLAQLQGVFNRRTDASLFAVGLYCEDCNGQERLEALSREIRPRVQRTLDEKFDGAGAKAR